MPIVRRADDPAAQWRLAQMAGAAIGESQRHQQQRQYDARLVEMAASAAMERNRRPGLFERNASRAAAREPMAGVRTHTAPTAEDDTDELLADFESAAASGGPSLARFIARQELKQKGMIDSDTASRLGLPTPGEQTAAQRAQAAADASKAKAGASPVGEVLKSLPAMEESAARAALTGNWSGALTLATARDPATLDPSGAMVPGTYTADAAKARTGILAAIPHQTADELEAGRAAFATGGDTEMAAAYEAEIERRDQVDLAVIAEKIAPQEHAITQALVARVGVPDSPQSAMVFEQAFRVELERVLAAQGMTLHRYMQLYDKQSAAVYAAANQALARQVMPQGQAPGSDDGRRIRPTAPAPARASGRDEASASHSARPGGRF